ncbi:MAG: colicin V production CvpA [Gammaproteobacteria bacterium]|nr:colicin V production CvpA [Gammaproteobacteria bacterium]
MNFLATVDWLIVAILAVSTLISIRRGFVKEALSVVTWTAAIIISRLFASQVSTLLVGAIEMSSLRLGAAYAMLFAGTLIVGGLLNSLVSEVIKMTGLGGTDKFFGMFFGFARGSIVILVVVAGLYYLAPVQEDSWWKESVLLPHVVSTIEWLGPILWEQGEQLIELTSVRGI